MIYEAINNYAELTDYIYTIDFSKEYNAKRIILSFNKSDFYHLAGIHKLSDIRHMLRGSKATVFNKLVNDNRICSMVENSKYYRSISFRVELVSHLRYILNGIYKIFPYTKSVNQWSKIKADYVIKFKYHSKTCYLFLIKKGNVYHVCNSIFDSMSDYTVHLKPYAIKSKRFISRKNFKLDTEIKEHEKEIA